MSVIVHIITELTNFTDSAVSAILDLNFLYISQYDNALNAIVFLNSEVVMK